MYICIYNSKTLIISKLFRYVVRVAYQYVTSLSFAYRNAQENGAL